MEFPIVRFDSKSWSLREDAIPLYDEFIYSAKMRVYNEYYYNMEFVDCRGDVYKVVDRVMISGIGGVFRRLIPGARKGRLVFLKTNRRVEFNEFRSDYISGVRRLFSDDSNDFLEFIRRIEQSSSIKEILIGDM